jgi:disulfide bond formation protein DsbB
MCHWQRWPHYAAVALAIGSFALRGAADRGRSLVWLAGVAIFVSGAIGVYHAGVELGVFQGVTACTSSIAGGSNADVLANIMATPLIRCDAIQFSFLGISMAGWNALISISSAWVILWLSLKRPRPANA